MENQSAEILWWVASFLGLVWWPGQFLAIYRCKTALEHSLFAWVVGTLGQLTFAVSGYLYGSPAVFWSMFGYFVLHVVMLYMVMLYRIRGRNAVKEGTGKIPTPSPR